MQKVIIVGSGLAASQVAAHLQQSVEVVMYTKKSKKDCNSMLAQGGLAVAIDQQDDWHEHYRDTLAAGVFHNNQHTTEILVKEGILDTRELILSGMNFDQNNDHTLQYGLEGAHSRPRILHSHGDQTGKFLTQFVQAQLKDTTIYENRPVVELLKNASGCCGVAYLDNNHQRQTDWADQVVLATGGIGQLYPLTTNDETITSDGAALAKRAGVTLADMEFVQFHPTLLTKNNKCYGLVSEAVRGAGAILVDETGEPFMRDYPQKDLSPRDVVARVLTEKYAQGHAVYLDITPVVDFEKKFPQITKNLDHHAIPFRTTHRIPVRPGAHFMMGGVQTDDEGHTSLNNLYAVGETACTGVHGANRLASNSLLECLVFGKRAAEAILVSHDTVHASALRSVPQRLSFALPDKALLQQKAWQLIGIERADAELTDFLNWLHGYHYHHLPQQFTLAQFEVANLCLTAENIAKAAKKRTQSLGAHARRDSTHESATTKASIRKFS
jgi:L-aspartate oxidase